MKETNRFSKTIENASYKLILLQKLTQLAEMGCVFHPSELLYIIDATNESVRQQRANAYSLLKFDPSHWVDHAKDGVPILMMDTIPSDFSISISHKENSVAAAISLDSTKKIGIDLEILNTGRDLNFLKGRVIDQQECSYLKNISDMYELSTNDALLFFWVLKEAAYKALDGKTDIDSFKISVVHQEIKLTCVCTGIIFFTEIIKSDEHLIAVVTVDRNELIKTVSI